MSQTKIGPGEDLAQGLHEADAIAADIEAQADELAAMVADYECARVEADPDLLAELEYRRSENR